jgi:hypothetical protein
VLEDTGPASTDPPSAESTRKYVPSGVLVGLYAAGFWLAARITAWYSVRYPDWPGTECGLLAVGSPV